MNYTKTDDGELPHLTFNSKQAARIVGCGLSQLVTMRKSGTGPKWIRLTKKRVVYRLEDLQSWLEEKASSKPR